MNIVFPVPNPELPGEFADTVRALLNGVTESDAIFWPIWGLPELYSSGVVYALEPNHGSGWEEFAHPKQVAARGWGDCDDLVRYRLAELRSGPDKRARAVADWINGDLHVQVRRGNGRLEDPSVILGAR